MLYTPGQLMDALALSKQQWRTFRKALPQLNSGPGHAPCFSAGHLVAVAVAQRIIEATSGSLAALSGASEQLFAVLTAASWPHLERSQFDDVNGSPHAQRASLVCPVRT